MLARSLVESANQWSGVCLSVPSHAQCATVQKEVMPSLLVVSQCCRCIFWLFCPKADSFIDVNAETKQARWFEQGSSWGFSKFFQRDTLFNSAEKARCLLPDDRLTIVCKVESIYVYALISLCSVVLVVGKPAQMVELKPELVGHERQGTVVDFQFVELVLCPLFFHFFPFFHLRLIHLKI